MRSHDSFSEPIPDDALFEEDFEATMVEDPEVTLINKVEVSPDFVDETNNIYPLKLCTVSPKSAKDALWNITGFTHAWPKMSLSVAFVEDDLHLVLLTGGSVSRKILKLLEESFNDAQIVGWSNQGPFPVPYSMEWKFLAALSLFSDVSQIHGSPPSSPKPGGIPTVPVF